MKISERTYKEARVCISDPYLRQKQDFCNAWSLELDLFFAANMIKPGLCF